MNKKMFLYLHPTAYVQKFPKAKLLKKIFFTWVPAKNFWEAKYSLKYF